MLFLFYLLALCWLQAFWFRTFEVLSYCLHLQCERKLTQQKWWNRTLALKGKTTVGAPEVIKIELGGSWNNQSLRAIFNKTGPDSFYLNLIYFKIQMLLKEIISYLFPSEHSYLITSNQKFPVSRMVLAGYWDSVCDCCSVTTLCLTLLTPWTAAPQAPLSFTIS